MTAVITGLTRGLGMGGHQSARMGKDEWLTPRHVLAALGPFDLDPCAPTERPWPTAARHLTIEDNGLAHDWAGRVWLNPPHGRDADTWLARLVKHGDGIALIFARTETEAFFRNVWLRATGVLFLRGRLTFCHRDGTPGFANAGAPSCLIAYGEHNARSLRGCGLHGAYVSAPELS